MTTATLNQIKQTSYRVEIVSYSFFVIIGYIVYFTLRQTQSDYILINDSIHTIAKLLIFCLPLLFYKSKLQQLTKILLKLDTKLIISLVVCTIIGYALYHKDIATATLLVNTPLFLIINSLIEESIYRGVFLDRPSPSPTQQNMLQALCFAIIHLPFYILIYGFNLVLIPYIVGIGLFGYLLGYLKLKTHNLTRPIVIHTLYNIVVIFILPILA